LRIGELSAQAVAASGALRALTGMCPSILLRAIPASPSCTAYTLIQAPSGAPPRSACHTQAPELPSGERRGGMPLGRNSSRTASGFLRPGGARKPHRTRYTGTPAAHLPRVGASAPTWRPCTRLRHMRCMKVDICHVILRARARASFRGHHVSLASLACLAHFPAPLPMGHDGTPSLISDVRARAIPLIWKHVSPRVPRQGNGGFLRLAGHVISSLSGVA
jgi:hypothetical protein